MKKIHSVRNVVLTFSIALVLGACSAHKSKNRQVEVKNLKERPVGYIIEIAPGQEALLEANFAGSIRVIDASKGIYEILPPYTQADIERVIPKVETSKNIIIEPELPVERKEAYDKMADTITDNQFKPCLDASESPRPTISVLNGSDLQGKGEALNRGQILNLSAQNSKSHPRHPTRLSFRRGVLPRRKCRRLAGPALFRFLFRFCLFFSVSFPCSFLCVLCVLWFDP